MLIFAEATHAFFADATAFPPFTLRHFLFFIFAVFALPPLMPDFRLSKMPFRYAAFDDARCRCLAPLPAGYAGHAMFSLTPDYACAFRFF